MKPIAVTSKKKKPLIMEVIGEKGQKVGEYIVDNIEKNKPYYELIEGGTINDY